MEESEILDISTWQKQEFFNTKGTRDKWIAESPNGFTFHFKKYKESSGYIHEFWSEIIAYHLGVMLELPVLRYEAAVMDNNIGCISQSMNGKDELLVEGVQYLQRYQSDFAIYGKIGQEKYTYQLIEKTLRWMGLSMDMKHILETIVFDAIIGNQDRHQENWGYVIKLNRNQTTFGDFANIFEINRKGYFNNKEGYSEYLASQHISHSISQRFAPIYDNGSSLGRELTEDAIKRMLNDQALIRKYINRGRSEIRWEGDKVTHFQMLLNLNRYSGYIWFDTIVSRIINKYNETHLHAIIEAVDQDVPNSFAQYRLSSERKALILQLITLRINYLKHLMTVRY